MLKNALGRIACGASGAVAVLAAAVLFVGPTKVVPALAQAFDAGTYAEHVALALDLEPALAPAHNASWQNVFAATLR